MKKLFNTLLTSLMFIGCTLPPLAIENDAQSQSVNTILICAKQIDIFQLRINGAKPPKEAFEYYLKKVKKYTTNNIVVHKPLNLNLEKEKINDFIQHYGEGSIKLQHLSKEDVPKFVHFAKEANEKKSSIVMIYTPELLASWNKERKLRGLAFTHSNKTNIVAYNAVNINNAPVITDTQAWKIVLTHEVGHRFHVPAKKDHNKMGHCTSRECVMYARPDWQTVVSVLFNGMPYDFCDKCKAELKEAKKRCNLY